MIGRTRRNILWLGGIALAYLALSSGPGLWRRAFPPDFAFEPIPGLPGFHRVPSAATVPASPALIGLEPVPREPSAPQDLRADLCRHLFGAPPRGRVPVAYFTDVRCQYCRRMTPLLIARAQAPASPIHLAWHELPLLGATSVLAARASLAAAAQGAGPELHARLANARMVPTPASLRRVAEDIGLDGDRLLVDMDAPAIDHQLAVSRTLADLFGFPGTPGLVIGRTAVLGRIEEGSLERLIARERAEAGTAPCA
ncbi:DSBA-like thioredoxin domain-containing protein [Rhodovulum sp. ES.010]|uniref:DsbA family protein n=1 Tax=Rhodovulum sp. ES.010 TaxID=1882821 RepID=UPI00092CC3DE|nr:DsbA family protein [Rhodovulum sp. ES.010]SIO52903.1 DSBA-like thioredoxin domain-containing protein [Rhodovulum sp. ES.010]